MTSGLQYLLPLESDELLYIITLTVHIQLANFKISKQTNHMACVAKCETIGP